MWDGDNLVACNPALQKFYSLENYARRQDGRFRPARRLTLDRAVWRVDDKQWWLYLDCSNISARIRSASDGDGRWRPTGKSDIASENRTRQMPACSLAPPAPDNTPAAPDVVRITWPSGLGGAEQTRRNNLQATPDLKRYYHLRTTITRLMVNLSGWYVAHRPRVAADRKPLALRGGESTTGLLAGTKNLIVTDSIEQEIPASDYRNHDDSKPVALMKAPIAAPAKGHQHLPDRDAKSRKAVQVRSVCISQVYRWRADDAAVPSERDATPPPVSPALTLLRRSGVFPPHAGKATQRRDRRSEPFSFSGTRGRRTY
jgi:hypothetical protein